MLRRVFDIFRVRKEERWPALAWLPFTLGVVIAVGAVWLVTRKYWTKPRKKL